MRSAIAAANVEVKHQTAEAPPNDIKLEGCKICSEHCNSMYHRRS